MVIFCVSTYGEGVRLCVCGSIGRSLGVSCVCFCLLFGSSTGFFLSLSAFKQMKSPSLLSVELGVFAYMPAIVCLCLCNGSENCFFTFHLHGKGKKDRGTEIYQLTCSQGMWMLCISIYSFFPALLNLVIWCSSTGHSANRAFIQGCVLSFLTEIIFRSITLRMPSHLSNIKLL